MDRISIIIPCYNEQESIPFLKNELYKVINSISDVEFEIIMVDNCSTDNTLNLMKELKQSDSRFHYISFSKNFGKDSSMYAGLKASTGDYVTLIDADLQDPPELIIDMYNILKSEDYDCVAAFRETRDGEPFLRSILAKWFYNLMNKISDSNMVNGARDFRLMKRKMVDAVISLEESERFTKGIFSWVGFKTKWLPFKNKERVAGKTKLPMYNAFTYAIRGIVSFSTAPLFIASIIGFVFCFGSFVFFIITVMKQLIFKEAVAGYASMMSVILFCFGLTFMLLGIIGQYLAQMYLEIKHRPKYIVKDSDINF
ncbi:MAG: glycosyltransferase family 2 protein [Lachnospiraceae bacterium]|nr:glycosyltransferase family 2 protein [Lachnospiraceae bacterium]